MKQVFLFFIFRLVTGERVRMTMFTMLLMELPKQPNCLLCRYRTADARQQLQAEQQQKYQGQQAHYSEEMTRLYQKGYELLHKSVDIVFTGKETGGYFGLIVWRSGGA